MKNKNIIPALMLILAIVVAVGLSGWVNDLYNAVAGSVILKSNVVLKDNVTIKAGTDTASGYSFPDTGQGNCYNATVQSSCPVANFPGQDAQYDSSNSATCDMSFTDNGDSTITDNCTGLTWQKCSFGLSGSACNTGTATTTPWRGALADCDAVLLCNDGTYSGSEGIVGDCSSNGGTKYSDWRLPNAKELVSIVNYGLSGPAVDTTYFPNTASDFYWTSSTNVASPSYAWVVHFNLGNVSNYLKANNYRLRCVR